MKVFSSLRIGQRLGLGFAMVTLLLAAVALVGVTRIGAVGEETDLILRDRFVKVTLAQTIENEVNRQARAVRTALIAGDGDVRRAELAKLKASAPVVADAVARLEATIHSPEGKSALAALATTRTAFVAREHELVAMIEADRTDEARTFLVANLLPVQDAYLKTVEALRETQVQQMTSFGEDAARNVANARTLMEALAVVAILAAIAIAVALTRSVVQPMREAVGVANEVAAGNLTVRIDTSRRDEAGEMLAALDSMTHSLASLVLQVRGASESIATGSMQVASGGNDLSQRTEQQASSLQQTAASMEELGTTVRANADNARQANQLAQGATEVARNGGQVVGQVVETMRGIQASSQKIADIIGTIDGIAFQTNILALNAAVEAARAGEQGRGFAVVASEVRALAQRSASAAKEIKSLISDSVERVENGAVLADRAGTTMQEVVGAIRRVNDIVGEIASASTEQSTGVDQVGLAVSQMDNATQQNAALVEESAAAAGSLSQQAQALLASVSRFRVPA